MRLHCFIWYKTLFFSSIVVLVLACLLFSIQRIKVHIIHMLICFEFLKNYSWYFISSALSGAGTKEILCFPETVYSVGVSIEIEPKFRPFLSLLFYLYPITPPISLGVTVQNKLDPWRSIRRLPRVIFKNLLQKKWRKTTFYQIMKIKGPIIIIPLKIHLQYFFVKPSPFNASY